MAGEVANITEASTMGMTIVGQVLTLFTQWPLVIITGFVVLGAGFAIGRKFFRIRH